MTAAANTNPDVGLTSGQKKQMNLQVLRFVLLAALAIPAAVEFLHGESACGASLLLGALVSWYLVQDVLPAAMGLKAERRWFVMCASVPLVLLSIVALCMFNSKDTGSSDGNDDANFDRAVAVAVGGVAAWHSVKDGLPSVLRILA